MPNLKKLVVIDLIPNEFGLLQKETMGKNMRTIVGFLFAVSFLISFLHASDAAAFALKVHLDYWDKANAISVKDGGLGGKLTPKQLSRLHEHMDLDHGVKGEYKRHTWSHDPEKVAEWAESQGMDKEAAHNAACIHDAADMAAPGPAGVNGYTATSKRRIQAEKILERLDEGRSPLSGWFTKRWPDWLEKPGSLARARYLLRSIEEDGLIAKVISCGSKVINVAVVGTTVFIIIYEGGNLVYSAVKEGLTSEEVVKRAARDVGIFGGAWIGARAGQIVCSPLLAMEPGGPVCYGICVTGFMVGGGAAGDWAAEKVTTHIYLGRKAFRVVKDDKDMKQLLQSVGYTVDGQSSRGKGRDKALMIFLVLLLFFTFFYAKCRKRRNLPV